MEQKDIDRLLICRAAVDKQREFNKARVEAYTTCKSVTEAKTLIELKTGVATTISADSAVKTADSIKSTLEAERTKMTLAMYDVIKGQGFESYDAFRDFNDKSNLEVFKECRPIQGVCDLCGLPELKDQLCFKKYGNAIFSCSSEGKLPEGATFEEQLNYRMKTLSHENIYEDSVYKEVMLVEKEGEKITYEGKILPVSYCPKDHGYHIIPDKCADFPFDVFWRA
jgi:hypothetical protein